MRIMIVQAEIEVAIKEYIERQISVNEGQEISVDFKATRGEDGATAEINISPAAQKVSVLAQATKATPVRRSAPAQTAPVVAEDAPVSVSPAKTVESTVETADVAPEAPVTETVPEITQNAVPAEVAQTEEVVEAAQSGSAEAETPAAGEISEEEAPVRPSGSLFAGLKRPNNN